MPLLPLIGTFRIHPMWEADPAEVGDELRQGDLLRDVFLPRLRVPVYTMANPAGQGHITTVAAAQQAAIVVSQCCQNEKGKYLSVAPVIGSRPVREPELGHWVRVHPDEDDPQYVYDCFCLDPVAGVVQHQEFTDREGEALKLRIADLAQATPVSGDWTEWRHRRVARMTPYGRRLLRTKLAYFWSRAEPEDARLLGQLDSEVEHEGR